MKISTLPGMAALLLAAAPAAAQQSDSCDVRLWSTGFTALPADVARLADITGESSRYSFFIRRTGELLDVGACAAPQRVADLARVLRSPHSPPNSISLQPVDAMLTQNSAYPRDWNDGALWSGVGLSLAATAGATARLGPLEAALAPVLVMEQNDSFVFQAFPDPLQSPYLNRWHGPFIDLPQRQGRGTRMYLDPGHSYVRVNAAGVRAGFSTQNIGWGPARRNALLLSGTAPGFAHAFVETDGLRRAGPVDAEAQLFVGRLLESEFYDRDRDNDHRALFGVIAGARPRGADGLYLGAGYLHMQQWDEATSLSDLLVAPLAGLSADSVGLPRDLRLFSLFFRWASAPGGMEIYGEWARQDSWEEWVRLLNPFDAPQAYTVGLQKLITRGETAVRFAAEFSHLADPLGHTSVGRGITTFYVSPHVRHGHTHRGQLLGAPIGPGSEAQFLGADVFWRHGRSSFSIERARYDDDAYHAVWGRHHATHGHDTEISLRGGHAFVAGPIVVDALLGYSRRYSRNFLGLGHVNYPGYPYRVDQNIHMMLAGRWVPRGAIMQLR